MPVHTLTACTVSAMLGCVRLRCFHRLIGLHPQKMHLFHRLPALHHRTAALHHGLVALSHSMVAVHCIADDVHNSK